MFQLSIEMLAISIIGIAALRGVFSTLRAIRRKAKVRKKLALIDKEIGIQLYATCSDSKWRWICRPAGFEIGGISRIMVRYPCDVDVFMDACITLQGNLELHIANVQRLSANTFELSVVEGVKPIDEESTAEWYETVFIERLTALITELVAKDELCLCISSDGCVYAGEPGKCSAILEFESMPDISLWGYIIEQLAERNIHAEVWNEEHLFVSWSYAVREAVI